jgi:hypothetical protein
MVVEFASSNTLHQTMFDDRWGRRVGALYSMSFMGITPLGNLTLGSCQTAWVQIPADVRVAIPPASYFFLRKIL